MQVLLKEVFFGCIAGSSVAGNLLLCLVLFRKRSMFKKTHNVLILSLAIADICMGIFLVATPGYVIPPQSFPRLQGLGGDIFCRVIFSTYCIFICGKASNATIMCLAIERWYAVVMPTKYKAKFGRHRIYIYIGLIWLFSSITEIFELFIVELKPDGSCEWIVPFYGETLENIFLLLHVTVTFYIPSVVTWVSFAHIWFRISRHTVPNQRRGIDVTRGVVRMCALAALFLTACWFPIETFWILKKYNVLVLPHTYYLVFNLLAFFSSCVNPVIYCLSNKMYRKEVFSLFRKLRCTGYDHRVAPGSQGPIELNDLPLGTVPSKTTAHFEMYSASEHDSQP